MTHSPPNSGSTCFITIEGGEGAGKTTLAQALAERLRAQGRSVRLTREPGGSALGQALRTLVLDPQLQLTDWSETCLFLADRGANVEGVIRPALAAGEIVFCDRYLDSTLAYQGYGRGLDLGLLRRLNEAVTGGLLPELTLLLDLPPELGLARTRARSDPGDRIGDAAFAFHQRVNAGFRALAEAEPSRIRVIDATQSAQDVLRDAWLLVERCTARA